MNEVKPLEGVEPFGERLIVKQDEAPKEKVAKSGLVTSVGSQKAPNYGTIVAVGSGRTIREKVKVGWRVVFLPYAATEIEIEDQKYFVLEEGGILAVFVNK